MNDETKSCPVASGPARRPPAGQIVIADDDPAFRESTARILEASGFICHLAENAFKARSLLAAEEYDLLIADIQMPGNEQLELLGPGENPGEGPPVLLVTGNPCVQTAAQAVHARAVGYLIKPMNVESLLETVQREVRAYGIRRFIQKRRMRAEIMLERLRLLEESAANSRTGTPEQELTTYLAMFSEQVVVGLRDLMGFVEAAAAQKTTEAAWRRLAEARPFHMTEVLRETVQVLEHTKSSFKSRELADLRKRLEGFLASAS